MATKLSNNATGRLAVSIDASDTQLALMPGDSSSFPVISAGDSFPLTLVKADGQLEIVLVTAANGSVFTVVRGQEGTSPKAFNAGDRVELRLTAGTFEKMISDEIGKSITDLKLGNASQRDVGTTSGTVAAGDDSRIVGAMQKDQNLEDVPNKEKARTNLGLGTAAELTATTGTTDSTSGRALRVGDFGLGVQSAPSFSQESKDERRPAGFYGAGSAASTPFPVTANVLHLAGYSDYQAQIGISLAGSTPRLFARIYDATVWRNHVELYHTGNLPATATRWPSWGEVTGRPATADRWPTWAEVTGKPSIFASNWANVADKPATATRWPTWAEVTGKPAHLVPNAHGGVGTYIYSPVNAGPAIARGGTFAGSRFTPTALAGTWRNMRNIATNQNVAIDIFAIRIS